MGNLVQRTTDTRNAADKASRLSLESDIVELTEQVDGDVNEVKEISEQVSAASDNIVQSDVGADSLSALVDNTVAIYGEQGIPEDAAKQLEVSVEAILRVMGHPGSFASVLPSFESCATPAQYSTEAEEKKNGVVVRIWEWIKKIFGQMADFVTGMIDKVRNSTESLKKLSAKLKEKVGKVEGASGDTVNVGGYGKFCHPTSAAQNIVSSTGHFKDFVEKWEGYFGLILSNDLSKGAMQDPERVGEAFVTIMQAEEKKLPEWEKLQVTAFHDLNVVKGSSAENPLIGAKITIEPTNAIKGDGVRQALTKEKMLQVLEAVDGLISRLELFTTDFGKYRENLKTLKSAGFAQRTTGSVNGFMSKEPSQKEYFAKVADAGKVLQALTRIGMDGMAKSVPAAMDVIRANLTYVNKSANAASKAKPAEAKTDA